MLITRTPMRISFVGGGSDLPAYYRKSKGAVLSTTINKYIYISVHPYFQEDKYLIKYSKTEEANDFKQIIHPLIRNALEMSAVKSGIELTSSADVPAGTGLGSSSSFTVGVLHSLYSFKGDSYSPQKLAEEACEIEIDRLNEPIGKQDQYAAAFGGLNIIEFHPDKSVRVEPIVLNSESIKDLENRLFVYYVGGSRAASKILLKQSQSLNHKEIYDIQRRMVDLVYSLRDSLISSNFNEFGRLLDKNWNMKKKLSSDISNRKIDKIYSMALDNGALGGKLLGAGGTGFMLFYCEPKNQSHFTEAMSNYRGFEFKFDNEGSKLIYKD